MSNLKYITFDQLMASVESDLPRFADNGMINRGTFIKVVRGVNHDLGLKIFREREAVVKIENYKGQLPVDFMYLQLGLICGEPQQYNLAAGTIWGTHTEENNVAAACVRPDNVCLSSNGTSYWVTQVYKEKTVKVTRLAPIQVNMRSRRFCSDKCLNTSWSSAYEMDIDENGDVVVNFREGELYINYLADMVDEDNNVLLLDHPLLTPYYEYAVKKRLLENLYLNGEPDMERRIADLKVELKDARTNSISFVNTFEYKEIQDVYMHNRNRFYNRYQKMFY